MSASRAGQGPHHSLPEDQGDLAVEGVKAGWRCDTSEWLVAEVVAKQAGVEALLPPANCSSARRGASPSPSCSHLPWVGSFFSDLLFYDSALKYLSPKALG